MLKTSLFGQFFNEGKENQFLKLREMVNAPLPGAFLLLSHELPMIKEVFIVKTLTQLVSLGVGHDALKIAGRLDSSSDLSGGG